MNTDQLKTCSKCHAAKGLGEFYRHLSNRDGLCGQCRDCAREYAKKHRTANLEAARAWDRKRCQSPERKAYMAAYRKAANGGG
jgi:hypothetical protein